MNRPPPRSNRPVPLFPTRRSSDLLADGDAADRAGRDVPRLPCLELAVDRIGRGAGPELQIDEAVDAAPAAALLVPIGDAADRVQLQMAVAGNVLEHAGDAQLALFARADGGDRAADDVDAAETPHRLLAAQYQDRKSTRLNSSH